MKIALINNAVTIITGNVSNIAEIKDEKSILVPSSNPAALFCSNKTPKTTDIDNILRIAVTTPHNAAVRVFAITIYLPETGSIKSVSRVPLSFSPAVRSILGCITLISIDKTIIIGNIIPSICPAICSLLESPFFSKEIGYKKLSLSSPAFSTFSSTMPSERLSTALLTLSIASEDSFTDSI